MKTRTLFILMAMIMTFGWSARADETITVSATNEDISQNLDLRAVASLFGQCANLEEFEQKLNSEETRISNLDLNGDGDVDYLRIVESADGNKHLVLIQAVLAKDIFQDVASIYVEKDPDNQIIVQVVGDEYIYGVNYIIEPAYLYVPVIYDWFWGPHWVCWYSPWYWGYWPGWWHAYHCWAFDRYWYHIHDYHHHHHYCSFRHTQHRAPGYDSMHRGSAAGRHDMALRHPEGSFERRNAGKMDASGRKLSNTRDIQRSRAGQTAVNRRGDNNRTFGSSNTRVARHDQASSAARSQSNSGVRGQSESRSQQASRGQASASRSQASTSRSQASTSRGQASTSRSGSTSTSSSTTKKSSSTARSSASTSTSRSSASTSTSRSSSSSSSRSSGSYGGSSRSGGSSAPSRSGGYGGGGGSRGGGSMGGGSHSGGGSRSGGGGGGHRR